MGSKLERDMGVKATLYTLLGIRALWKDRI